MKSLDELNLKDKKVIIFDLDGTLIDSIGVWNMTDQKLIKDYSGTIVDLDTVQVDRDNFLHNNTGSDIYIAYCDYLINKYGLSVKDPNELSDIRKDTANEVLKSEIGFKPDVARLILKLKKLGYTVALATITTESQLEIYYRENQKMLREMNIQEVFDLITTKETVKNKKPDPEVYLKVMEHFNVKPSECLIFEDSYAGTLAGKTAGVEVVNIYDKYADVERDKINEIADYSILNYREFIDTCVKPLDIKYSNWEDCHELAMKLYQMLGNKLDFWTSSYINNPMGVYFSKFRRNNGEYVRSSNCPQFTYWFANHEFLNVRISSIYHDTTIGEKLAALSDFYEVISEDYGEPTFFYTLKDDPERSICLHWSFDNAKEDIGELKNGTYFDPDRKEIDKLIIFGESNENDKDAYLSDKTKKIIARQVGLPYELIHLAEDDYDNFYKHKKGVEANTYTRKKIKMT